jgi:tetratricopeptide (TPR) repeat protein
MMKGRSIILLVLIMFFFPSEIFSQNFHTLSNRALKAYKDGVSAYDYFDYNSAETYFREAISIDNKFYEAYLMLGEVMTNTKNFPQASIYYGSAVRIDSLYFKPLFFNLANAEMKSGLYNNALIHYNVYLAQEGMSEE